MKIKDMKRAFWVDPVFQSHLPEFKRWFLAMLICVSILEGLILCGPFPIQTYMHDFVAGANLERFYKLSGLIGLIPLVSFGAEYVLSYFRSGFHHRTWGHLREVVVSKFYAMPMQWQKAQGNDGFSGLLSHVSDLNQMVIIVLFTMIPLVGRTILRIVGLFFIHPMFGLISAVNFLAYAVYCVLVRNKLSQMNTDYTEEKEWLVKFTNQLYRLSELHAIHGLSDEVLLKYREMNREFIDRDDKRHLRWDTYMVVPKLYSVLNVVFIYAYGGWWAFHDPSPQAYKVGLFMLLTAWYIAMSSNLEQLVHFMLPIARGLASLEKLAEFMMLTPGHKPDQPIMPNVVSGAITLSHVHFAYNEGERVLHDISLEILPGKTLAIVGPTGSGKSSLVQLITGVEYPSEGIVLLDGISTRDVDPRYLLNFGFMPQNIQLPIGRVKDVIRTLKSGASDEEVEQAAQAACAHDFIMKLPHQYETVLTGNGGQLSGGERQRILLAMVLLRQPKVVILDEPTSALDAHTTTFVAESIAQLKAKGSTIIVIAHNLSTVKDVDEIVVLESGRVTGRGSHTDLVSRSGWYAQALQSKVAVAM